jgi:hypothetical protein
MADEAPNGRFLADSAATQRVSAFAAICGMSWQGLFRVIGSESEARMATVTITDESTLGEKRSWDLDILEETITLAELIRRRIYQEVTEYNAKQVGYYYGLVQPTEAERALNGYQMKKPRQLDWEAQYTAAEQAFLRRGFIVLVNDHQVTDLTATVTLSHGSEVTFLKLVPLVGG